MASKDPREKRFHGGWDAKTNRSAFQRDRDRVMYSGYFRRLSGVSQVASAIDGDHFHNRLSHTLEVSQLARRMAERLTGVINERKLSIREPEPEVAEAAALARRTPAMTIENIHCSRAKPTPAEAESIRGTAALICGAKSCKAAVKFR